MWTYHSALLQGYYLLHVPYYGTHPRLFEREPLINSWIPQYFLSRGTALQELTFFSNGGLEYLVLLFIPPSKNGRKFYVV